MFTTALVVAALLGAACGSESPLVERAGDPVSAEVVGPTGVSAAVIDFTLVASVEAANADVFTTPTETGFRAVVVLHEPGAMKLTLRPSFPAGGVPSATLIDVSDDTFNPPASPEAYRVVLGS